MRDTKEIGKIAGKYTYDKVNNVRSIKYPNARFIERDFDQLNRMNKIREGSVNIAEMTHIGRSYRLLNKQYGNGDLINYLYDHGRRLTSKDIKNKNSELINKYVYGYNKVHMKMYEQRGHDSDKGDVFGYDEIYRLKNVKFNSSEPTNPDTSLFEKSKTIDFDKLHNIMRIVETQNQTTNEIFTTIEENNAKLNQYTTFDQWGMDYDLNGNTIQKGTQFFTYDYRNQLVSVTDSINNSTVNLKYDALGRRIEKSNGTNTVNFYYSGNQVIEERDDSDSVLKQYIYGNGIDEILRMEKSENGIMIPYYFHTNSIGSVTAITDQNGQLVERVSYDLYGMPTFTDYQTDPQNPQVVGSSVIDNELLFQGRRYEKETNLIYFRARYFDPIMGRFLSVDPMGYQDSMNLYQAFNMNPVNLLDPWGRLILNGYRLEKVGDKFKILESLPPYTDLNFSVIRKSLRIVGFTRLGKLHDAVRQIYRKEGKGSKFTASHGYMLIDECNVDYHTYETKSGKFKIEFIVTFKPKIYINLEDVGIGDKEKQKKHRADVLNHEMGHVLIYWKFVKIKMAKLWEKEQLFFSSRKKAENFAETAIKTIELSLGEDYNDAQDNWHTFWGKNKLLPWIPDLKKYNTEVR